MQFLVFLNLFSQFFFTRKICVIIEVSTDTPLLTYLDNFSNKNVRLIYFTFSYKDTLENFIVQVPNIYLDSRTYIYILLLNYIRLILLPSVWIFNIHFQILFYFKKFILKINMGQPLYWLTFFFLKIHTA